VDIRRAGSGNAGGTNAFRTRGWRFALGVVVIDIGKGALAAWLGFAAGGLQLGCLCAFAAVLGHCWPVFFGFRGGKGAATLIGAVAVLVPAAVAPLFVVWVLVLTASGYVGLSTVCAGAVFPLAAWVSAPGDRVLLGFAVAAAVLVLFTHRENLARLRAGTEHRFDRARVWARWLGRAR
jgi:glycerol-3-phosphate acyltransferase PlsY